MGLYYNLSIEEREFAKKKSFFCLIIYDIVSNKRRLQVARRFWDESPTLLF